MAFRGRREAVGGFDLGCHGCNLFLTRLHAAVGFGDLRGDGVSCLFVGQVRLAMAAILQPSASRIAKAKILQLPDGGDVEVGLVTFPPFARFVCPKAGERRS